MPLNSKANAPRIIRNPVVVIGNSMRTIESAITTTPSPMLAIRELLFEDDEATPLAILSSPNIRKIIERNKMTVTMEPPGIARITNDNKMAIPPNTI